MLTSSTAMRTGKVSQLTIYEYDRQTDRQNILCKTLLLLLLLLLLKTGFFFAFSLYIANTFSKTITPEYIFGGNWSNHIYITNLPDEYDHANLSTLVAVTTSLFGKQDHKFYSIFSVVMSQHCP